MIGQEGEAGKVMAAIARQLKIGRNSLCLCGSSQKWKHCCGLHPDRDPIFLQAALKTARAYKNSQGTISALPAGIWRAFERTSLNRFRCLYPGCHEKPVNCHLVSENVLRSYYGGHCKEYGMEDTSGLSFVRTGIGKAGGLPVFCNHHDNGLFKEIDQLQIFLKQNTIFPICIESGSFFSSKLSVSLGHRQPNRDHSTVYYPGGAKANNCSHLTIDISNLQEQYVRFLRPT